MLTIWGARQHFCDRLTRRNFLAIGAFGAGLTLSNLLRLRAAQPGCKRAGNKAALMIYLSGGPSHLDMYDLKPSAPAEIRGEFRPIQTNVAGVEICELFPRQAQMWDKLAVIRSIVAADEHSDSEVMTGYREAVNRRAHHPSLGAVVSKVRPGQANVPPFVSLRGMSVGLEPGYLGIAHRAFAPTGPGYNNLSLVEDVTPSRVTERKDLLASFDTLRRDLDAGGTMGALDKFQVKAFDMIASGTVRKALDLGLEDPRSRDRYEGFEQFLTARRLIEAGVGCVTVSIGAWDTHTNNFKALKRQLPKVDRAVATLIGDLHERGLDQEIVTVMWGEFGRAPRINAEAGRDHWGPVMSALIAGGGLRMGQAVGSSSARGEYPKERPYRVSQVLATIYQALGIDPAMTFPNEHGRPMYVLDDREPVRELLG
jgi:hypothetical protein